MSRLDRPIAPTGPEDRLRLHSPASSDEDPVLADLVEELTARLQGGAVLDGAALAREFPDHAEQLLELLPALEALAQVGASVSSGASASGPRREQKPSGLTTHPCPPPGTDHANEGVLGDFRIIREVGRGGMGVVYEAEQLSLGRRVALKVLPFASALHPRQVQRFKNEAMAAAQLHHGHIVPVYAVGCERGVHFYAMQFIDGATLADVVRELRQERDRAIGQQPAEGSGDSPTTRSPGHLATLSPSQFCRSVAGLMVQAADALEYAHQGGVIHRDVKPANLMLDGDGCLWVTDFGLACCRHAGPEGGLTGTGELPGTLRYMSPEQALGPRAVVDHRTDVYALGATLYELLTLEPVCPGETRHELLSQVASEEPHPPRRHNRAIPVELETIVLKAVAKNVTERYATANDLADDLRRFLEDRPIRARRPSLLERGKRWLRRHRSVVWAAVAVAVVAVAGLAVSAVLIAHQRDEAEMRRMQARLVVDRMYTDVAEKWLAQQPHLEPMQREFLQNALEFYEDLMRQRERDPGLRLATGQAARRVGDIRQKLGEYDRAEEAYTRAAEVLQSLGGETGRPDARAELAFVLNHQGNLLRRRGRLAEARQAYLQAGALFADLVRQFPDEPAHRGGLAGSNNNLGMIEHNLGHFREAESAYRRAASLLRQMTVEDPQHPVYRHDLAGCVNNLGYLLHDLGRRPEAEKAYQSALVLWRKLTSEFPTIAVYRQAEATCLYNLGGLRAATGRVREAEKAYRTALARRIQLAESFPRVTGYRQELAASRYALGMFLAGLGRFPEAEQLQREAFSPRNELAAAFPGILEFQRDLAASHDGFGSLLAATGRTRQAEEAYRAALALRARLVSDPLASNQSAVPCRRELAFTRHHLGIILTLTGRPIEAEKLYHQALAALEDPAKGPAPISQCTERALLWSDLGRVLHAVGRTAEAEKAYRQAETLLAEAPAVQGEASDPYAAEILAESRDRLGALLHGAGRMEEAQKSFALSRTGRTRLAKDHPDVAGFHGGLAWFLATCPDARFRDPTRAVACATKARDLAPLDGNQWRRLGVTRYRVGDWRGAAAALERAVELCNGGDRTDFFFLAMTRWQMRDEREALRWYDRARAGLGKDVQIDEELRRIQAEAAALIRSQRMKEGG